MASSRSTLKASPNGFPLSTVSRLWNRKDNWDQSQKSRYSNDHNAISKKNYFPPPPKKKRKRKVDLNPTNTAQRVQLCTLLFIGRVTYSQWMIAKIRNLCLWHASWQVHGGHCSRPGSSCPSPWGRPACRGGGRAPRRPWCATQTQVCAERRFYGT